MNHWIGIDLGGTKIFGGIFRDGVEPLATAKEATPHEGGPTAVIAKVDEIVEELLTEASVERSTICGLGFIVPGQINPRNGNVRYAPNLGWEDVDLLSLLPSDWNWPSFVENDVRMGTYAEWKHGAARGAQHVLGVFPGTGVGGGLILDGKLYHGFNLNAGEFGHLIVHWRRGKYVEDYAGRRNLMKWAEKVLPDWPKKVRKAWKDRSPAKVKSSHLFELFESGDALALRLFDDAALALGAGIGGCINLLSPEIIVMGGGFAEAFGDVLTERVWEIACRYALPGAIEGVRLVKAELGDNAGIVGAATYARERVASK
jgi:glucokinase